MKKYLYVGKVRTAAGRRLIFPNCEYELPSDDAHVKSLVAQGLLKEAKSETDKKASPKKQSTNKENTKQ